MFICFDLNNGIISRNSLKIPEYIQIILNISNKIIDLFGSFIRKYFIFDLEEIILIFCYF